VCGEETIETDEEPITYLLPLAATDAEVADQERKIAIDFFDLNDPVADGACGIDKYIMRSPSDVAGEEGELVTSTTLSFIDDDLRVDLTSTQLTEF
jgi:hypothetical protein